MCDFFASRFHEAWSPAEKRIRKKAVVVILSLNEAESLLFAVDLFELRFVGKRHVAFDSAVVERVDDPRLEIAEEPPQVDDAAAGR